MTWLENPSPRLNGLKPNKHKYRRGSSSPVFLKCTYQVRGGSGFFNFLMGGGGGADDTNRQPNYTLIYFKLSYVCPRTWRIRKDEGWLASQGFSDPRISIFLWDPRISLCFSTCHISWWAVLNHLSPRLFTVLYSSVRSSRSSALRYSREGKTRYI